jgi:S-adenosylmethionine:tRNA ribosyltransferase-isomerase
LKATFWRCISRDDERFRLANCISGRLAEAVDRVGHIPLPPYIKRRDEEWDKDRYQTVYALDRGSVAAPTAGLHFTAAQLAALAARGIELAHVTLHVGYGTFKPVKVEHVEAHVVDAERFTVSAKRLPRSRVRGATPADHRRRHDDRPHARIADREPDGTVLAESARNEAVHSSRSPIQLVDAIITNFHLPRSSLLMLVAAFAGREQTLSAYREAVDKGTGFTVTATQC